MPAILVQDAFRGRRDSVGLNINTFDYVLNTNWTQVVDETFRIRFDVENNSYTSYSSNVYWYLYFSVNSGSYVQATTTGSIVRIYDSTQFADQDRTTTSLLPGTGTYQSGYGVDASNRTNSFYLPPRRYTELEFSLRLISSGLSNGDTVSFRIYSDGSPLNTYNQVPTLTVRVPVNYTLTANGGVFSELSNACRKTVVLKSPYGVFNETGIVAYKVVSPYSESGLFDEIGGPIDFNITRSYTATFSSGLFSLQGSAIPVAIATPFQFGSYAESTYLSDKSISLIDQNGFLSVIGQDIDFSKTGAYSFPAWTGFFSLTGESVSTSAGINLFLQNSSHSLSGNLLESSISELLKNGSIVFSGFDVLFNVTLNRNLDGAFGIFNLGGFESSTQIGVSFDGTSFSESGEPAKFSHKLHDTHHPKTMHGKARDRLVSIIGEGSV